MLLASLAHPIIIFSSKLGVIFNIEIIKEGKFNMANCDNEALKTTDLKYLNVLIFLNDYYL